MTKADAYELAAQWHDKRAWQCVAISQDEPRIGADARAKAADAAKHHAASAAGLRAAAYDLRRAAINGGR
jgi:hypothetical protein